MNMILFTSIITLIFSIKTKDKGIEDNDQSNVNQTTDNNQNIMKLKKNQMPAEPRNGKQGIQSWDEVAVDSPQNLQKHPVYTKTYFDPQSIFKYMNRQPLKMKKKLSKKISKILKRYHKYPYKVTIGWSQNAFDAKTRSDKDSWAETFAYTKLDDNFQKLRKGKWLKANQVLSLKAYWQQQKELDESDPTRVEPYRIPIRNKIMGATYQDPTPKLFKKCRRLITPTDCQQGSYCKWCKEQHFCTRTTHLDGTTQSCDMQVQNKTPLSGPTWNPKMILN